MLSDDGHQVGEIDRRIEVEVRIHELSTKLVRELPVAVVLRCLSSTARTTMARS
jgi:hypothetical protein